MPNALETQPYSLQRKLEALSKAGVLDHRRNGRRVYIAPDRTSPVFEDIWNLLEKTAGLLPVERAELETLGDGVRLAFVYGLVARSEETSASDSDLMVVGKVGYSDLIPALLNCERTLSWPIYPTVYALSEFQEKARIRGQLLLTVLKGGKEL